MQSKIYQRADILVHRIQICPIPGEEVDLSNNLLTLRDTMSSCIMPSSLIATVTKEKGIAALSYTDLCEPTRLKLQLLGIGIASYIS